jgi:hypothetical protein
MTITNLHFLLTVKPSEEIKFYGSASSSHTSAFYNLRKGLKLLPRVRVNLEWAEGAERAEGAEEAEGALGKSKPTNFFF